MIYPELAGKLNGLAVRVPILNASLTDAVFEMSREVTVEDVNERFRVAAEGELAGILGYEDRPLVSADFTNDPRSGIVDGPSTMVIDGRMLKACSPCRMRVGPSGRRSPSSWESRHCRGSPKI